MKKQAALLFALLIMIVSAGCTPTSSVQPKETSSSQQEQPASPEKQASSKPAAQHIGAVVSLGDTQEDWETALGHPYSQGDSLKVYKNGAYQVVFQGDKAITITCITQNGNHTLTNDILPKDGKKESSSTKDISGITMTVEKWHSDLLAASIPATNGMYTIMKNKKGNTYDNIVIDCSPNLKK